MQIVSSSITKCPYSTRILNFLNIKAVEDKEVYP